MADTTNTDSLPEDLADQTRLRSMGFRDGQLHLELEPAHEIVRALVASARAILDGAENYTELTFEASDGGERYVLTLQRPGRLTPHEARARAESERDEARRALALAEQARDDFRRACQAEEQGGAARLAEARSYRLESPHKAVDPAVHSPERVAAYLTARGWRQREAEPGLWDLGDLETVFAHRVATASDYAGRVGLLASDLASVYKMGELQVLADIAEAGDD